MHEFVANVAVTNYTMNMQTTMDYNSLMLQVYGKKAMHFSNL